MVVPMHFVAMVVCLLVLVVVNYVYKGKGEMSDSDSSNSRFPVGSRVQSVEVGITGTVTKIDNGWLLIQWDDDPNEPKLTWRNSPDWVEEAD